MSTHSNISVFVPHIGCPHQCSFCNQFLITGEQKPPTTEVIKKAVLTATTSKGYNPESTELAFFGGSFTAIDLSYMEELLKVGHSFVLDGSVKGIRISTRPDAIDENILNILKKYSVTAIELGCQSMDDEVLKLNNRGHFKADVISSSKLIKEYGFSLGLQMMTGLYGDTEDRAISTAEEIIKLEPETVRIYPTILFKGTYLYELYKKGEYKPQTLDEAVTLTARLLSMFRKKGIKVIRTGLHSVELEGMVDGPWHPAFGELCESRIMLEKVLEILKSKKIVGKNIIIQVPENSLSKMLGQRKANVEFLNKMGYNVKVCEASTNEITVKEI